MDSWQLQDVVALINSIKELAPAPTPHWLTSLTTISAAVLGAAAGGYGVFLSTHRIEKSKVDRERASILAALQAEVAALMAISRHRGYFEEVTKLIYFLEQEGPDAKAKIEVNIRENFSPVFAAHISKIGLLDAKLAGDIVTFYQLAESLAIDVRPGCLLAVEGGNLRVFKETEAVLNRFFSVGEEIVKTKLDR